MGRLVGWLLVALPWCAQAAENDLVLGDSWVYRSTYESVAPPHYKTQTWEARYVFSYLNVLGKPAFERYDRKPKASIKADIHAGMTSDTCLIDIPFGKAVPGDVPCDDPLPLGKSWYARVDHEFLEEWLTVTGQEEVKVGPRSWRATVIRSDRTDLNDFDVGADGVSARKKTRTTYWYVPELKGMARIVREHLDGAGRVQFHESSELLEFTPASAD